MADTTDPTPKACHIDTPSNASHESKQLLALQRVMRKKKLSPFPYIAHQRKRAYATAMAITGMHVRACELAGVDRRTPNTPYWRNDSELQEAIAEAKEMSAQLIEDALMTRAVDGTTRQTGWYQGEAGGEYQEFDTTAAIFLLKGLKPEKYADRQVSRSTSLNVSVDLKALPDSVISQLRSGVDYQTAVATWVAQLRADGQPVPAGLLGDGGD